MPEVSFIVDLNRERAWAVCWALEATVSVRCDHVVDCGMHTIEEMSASFDTPVDAARGLVEAATWLLERATTEPLDSWRERDDTPGQHRVFG
ncbi:hypothetical protein ACIG5E_20905 [Kitasatospora sp. NPDC053057]|uniref:hypothetical protein n=1 Tax=Kitasatospora sp. NPDC053057 TaxID=3364062 RepID=UPI0037CC0C88